MNQYRTGFLGDNFVVIEDAFCRKSAMERVTNFNRINGIELDSPLRVEFVLKMHSSLNTSICRGT